MNCLRKFNLQFTGLLKLLICFVCLSLLSCSQQQAQQDRTDFTLQSASGPVSLQDYRGKVGLLFFGYTHCPDVCPATMNHVAQALHLLTGEQSSQVVVFFVSVDPERDSAAHLAEYVSFFHPNIIGLSGSMQQIKQTTAAYDVEFFKEMDENNQNYDVVHSGYLFLINRDGKVSDIMSHHTEPKDIAIALRKWLNPAP